MDRQIVYEGQIPLETDLLNTSRNFMVGLAGIAAAMFGSTTMVRGLACTPTSPASMQVKVSAGEIYTLQNLDDSAYGSLALDINHQIMKQGIALDSVNLNCPAPGTAGQSINYLIEAKFVESDTTNITLPYYNASDPSSAYTGPANSGTAQPTQRRGTISIIAKPGIAATTGTQTTPAADAGYTGLWVVTVANGASSITSGNIMELAGAPFVPTGGIVSALNSISFASRAEGAAGTDTAKAVNSDVMAQSVQSGTFLYGAAGGSANALTLTLVPAPAALAVGMEVVVKATATNTGPATLNVNTVGAKPITYLGNALQAGMLVNGQLYALIYDGTDFQLQTPSAQGIVAYSLGVNGWELYSHGALEQWGTVSLGSGSNTLQSSASFPIAFPTVCWNCVATALGPANGSFRPIVITIDAKTASNFSYTADTTNNAQAIAAGKSFDYRAKGN